MRAVLRETFLARWSTTDVRLKPDASVALTFYEADGTTPLTTPIYANKTGSTLATRTTDANGGFIGYSDIGKPVVIVIDDLPVMSGFVRYGDSYVNPMDFGATGDGTTNDYPAFALAVAYAISTSRRLWVPEGTYNFLSTLVIPSLLWMAGDGPGTIFRHGDVSANPVLQIAGGAVRNVLENFRVDGNYAANHDAVTGFTSDEVFLGGSYGTYRDIEIFNNNGVGADVSGSYNHYSNIRAIGPNVAIASYASTATQNMGGLYGLQCSGASTSVGNYWEDLSATGYRSAGVYIGGQYCRGVGIRVDNCHRQYFPDSPPRGGGQFAISTPSGGTQQFEIIGLQVGPAAVGSPATNGAELGAGTFITLVEPQIIGQTNHGISVVNVSELKVIGGVVNGVGDGLVLDSVSGGSVQGLQTQSCGVGLVLAGTTDYVDFRGVGFSANTSNWSNTSSGTHNTGGNWRVRSGVRPDLPNEVGVPSVSAACSAADTLTTSFADITGCAVSLPVGTYMVAGVLAVNRDAGVNDATATYQGKITVGTATATIGLSTSFCEFGPITAGTQGQGTQLWPVTVTVAGTIKLQARKGAGTGTSAIRTTHTTISAYPLSYSA